MKKKLKINAKIICRAAAALIVTAAAVFFTTDLIRAKRDNLPPLFCVPVIEYSNGSRDYYGLGYKVWEDYHPYDKTTQYYICFWFIPKSVHL